MTKEYDNFLNWLKYKWDDYYEPHPDKPDVMYFPKHPKPEQIIIARDVYEEYLKSKKSSG